MANPVVVDSVKLVHERQRIAGVIAVAVMPRLVESLHVGDGDLEYAITGDTDHRERSLLRLQISGPVQLQCQRCLEGFAHELAIDTALRLVSAGALDAAYEASGGDPDEPDCIAASKTLDVVALIEDEVLLALPPYPVHAPHISQGASVCEVKSGSAGSERAVPDVGAEMTAFSALKALKPG